MTTCEIHDLPNFGFGDFMAKYTNHSKTLFMHCQHDFKCLCMGHAKKMFQNMDDKFHRSIVVVQQQYLIQWWALGLWARFHHD